MGEGKLQVCTSMMQLRERYRSIVGTKLERR